MSKFQLLPIYASVLIWHIGVALVAPFTSIWLFDEIGESSFLKLGIALSIPGLIGIIGIFGISDFTDKRGYYRESIFIINIVGMLQYLLLTLIKNSTHYLIIVGTAALIFPAYYTIILAFATNICDSNQRGAVTSYLMLCASAGFFLGSLGSGRGFRILGMIPMLLISSFLILSAGIIILFAPRIVYQERSSF
ncbi:MAG: hypothetical protein ACXAD7_20240 [Candidatus Kariarchaeaceae archaeon]